MKKGLVLWRMMFGLGASALMVLDTASAETSLILKSSPGDFVGQGKEYSFTSDNAEIWALPLPGPGQLEGLQVIAREKKPQNQAMVWTLGFRKAGGGPLSNGSYVNLTRLATAAQDQQAMEITGYNPPADSRTCTTLSGSFEVKHIEYTPDFKVSSLYLTFEQRCDGSKPPLQGVLKLNYSPPGCSPSETSEIESLRLENAALRQRFSDEFPRLSQELTSTKLKLAEALNVQEQWRSFALRLLLLLRQRTPVPTVTVRRLTAESRKMAK